MRDGDSEEVAWPVYLCIERRLFEDGRSQSAEMIAALLEQMQWSQFSAHIRVSVVLFADDIVVLRPLDAIDPLGLDAAPALDVVLPASHVEPRFGSAFAYLRTQIGKDVEQLQADGYVVRRPCVCLLTAGWAADNWAADHENLIDYDSELGTGFPCRPDIVAVPVAGPDQSPDVAALCRMVMPRRRSSVLSPDIDARDLLATLIGRRPMVPRISGRRPGNDDSSMAFDAWLGGDGR